MALLDKIIKRKKKTGIQEPDALPAGKKENGEGQPPENGATDSGKKIGTLMPGVLRAAHTTEKTSAVSLNGTYAFAVYAGANKVDVKRAVEERYGVRVGRVNILNTAGKERRRGKQVGWKPGFKKAIVTLQEGERIDIQ